MRVGKGIDLKLIVLKIVNLYDTSGPHNGNNFAQSFEDVFLCKYIEHVRIYIAQKSRFLIFCGVLNIFWTFRKLWASVNI